MVGDFVMCRSTFLYTVSQCGKSIQITCYNFPKIHGLNAKIEMVQDCVSRFAFLYYLGFISAFGDGLECAFSASVVSQVPIKE